MLTGDDIGVLLKALDAYETAPHLDGLLGEIFLGSLGKREQSKEEIEAARAKCTDECSARKAKTIRIRVKLLDLRDELGAPAPKEGQ